MAYYSTVRRVLIIIIILNLSAGLIKSGYGLYINSLSMATDGLHFVFDSSSNIIGLVGIAIASKPPDKEHPYGHSRFETFASIGIAVLLFASCFQVVEAAVNRFLNPSFPEITYWSFAIMGAMLAVNVAVAAYEYIIGRRLKSSILVADSMHTGNPSMGSAMWLCTWSQRSTASLTKGNRQIDRMVFQMWGM
ncbi:MAG TPA: cation diffusion facilitator family transporter [Methanothrix sp.]|nr:cation diffusion facilitator family transporter [Methanothrix sp.]